MSAIAPAISVLAREIAERSRSLGREVRVDEAQVTDRSDVIALEPAGLWSPNRSCRMVEAADGWIAVNLARDDDRGLVPAWLRGEGDESWESIVTEVRKRDWRDLVADARLLGLPVASVGEMRGDGGWARLQPAGEPHPALVPPLRVLDLSALWAGPLCGALLAELGADVTKVESRRRPDPTRDATPALFARLNGAKRDLALDFADEAGRAMLRRLMIESTIVITSARPRAFDQLGLSPASIFAENPALIWVTISGYGWGGEGSDRVAFGDDAAAAGGLVRWTASGEPHFLGDALADPITGMAAAAGAMRALGEGGGVLVDVVLARCAAIASRIIGI